MRCVGVHGVDRGLDPVLAVAAQNALRYRLRAATPIVWLFVAATLVDLTNDTVAGVRERLLASAAGTTWMILVFYVPALWITLVLISREPWQLTRLQLSSPLVPARND
jgi:hypothetical protein